MSLFRKKIEYVCESNVRGGGNPRQGDTCSSGPSDIRSDVRGGMMADGTYRSYPHKRYQAPARHHPCIRLRGGCGGGGKEGPFAVFDPFAYRPIVMVLGDTGKKMELTQNEAKLLMEDLREALEEMEKYMEEKI